MSIADNLAALRARIDAAANRAGRDPAEITLVAVSKTKPAEMVEEAAAAGQNVFGENYVQEALAKQLSVSAKVEWHLVGSLQTNKAKQVVGRFALLHAVDSEKLARELDKRAAAQGVERVDALLEINLAGEESKAGIAPGEASALLGRLRDLARLRFRGLMAMPPPEDGEANRPRFRALKELSHALSKEGLLPEKPALSMGTTGDFEAAIEEGATLVRIGTAIFGERERKA